MKSLFLALIFCFFICGMRAGLPITWNNLVTVGDWSNTNNWVGGVVPTTNDAVTLVTGTTVSITSQVTVDQVTSANNMKLVVTNNAVFTVNNNFTVAGTTTIQVDAGSTFSSVSYFIFSGSNVNFVNFGSTLINPLVVGNSPQGTISNVAIGNNVVFQGTRPNLINADLFVPSGFQFATGVTQTFRSLLGSTLTLGYMETIAGNGWLFDNSLTTPPAVVFQNGVNINSAISVNNNGVAFARPTITFAGTVNIGNNLNIDAIPVIGNGGVVIFNGNFILSFFNLGATINAMRVQGTGGVNFNNANPNSVPTTVTFSQTTTSIENPNLNFISNWIFSGPGRTISYTTAKTMSFNLTLAANTNVAFRGATTLSTGSLFINLGGSLTFTDSLIANNAITFTALSPTFDCSFPNKAFAITGTSQLTFPVGLTVNGCAVSSSAQLQVSASVTTSGGNTTLPSSPSLIVFNNGITFAGTTNPSGGLYGITLNGQITVPNGLAYVANRVELTLPTTPVFVVSDNAQLQSSNGGLFTLAGGVQFGSGVVVTAPIAFNSGTPTITSTARVNFNVGSSLLLRNTVIGGNADIWFNVPNIISTKGISTISNPNFKFKGGITLSYLWDQNVPDSGCQLVINTNGATGTRFIEGSVNAGVNTNVVFDDNINLNTTATVTGVISGNLNGAVTFRTSGQTQAFITTNSQVTLSVNIYFNQSNFHFLGIGNYFFANSPNIFVQGSLNNPTIAGDAVVVANELLTVRVVSNSTFGNTISLNSGLTTDDLDGISTTAVTKLTLANAVTQSRNIAGPYILGSSLTFGGNVVVQSGTTINSPGTIEILGSSISLQTSATWRNLVVFPGAMTITSTSGSNTLTFGDQTPTPHGLNIPSTFTVTNPASVVFDSLFTVNFQTASTLGGTGVVTFSNSFVTSSAAVTISPQTVTLNNVTLIGTGSFTLNPADNNLNAASLARAFVPTTYSGTNLTLTAATTISNLVTFTANPLNINGAFVLTISAGAYTVNTRWVNNNNNIIFQGATTLATTGSFAGTGSLQFNNSLILTQSTTITQNVAFGFSNTYIVTVSNNGFVLTLTGNTINVNSIVVSNGGSIVSTSRPLSVQNIVGGGVINSDWTWSNTVQFGALNITGPRTLTFNLILTNGLLTVFNDGVTFNGGTFVTNVASDLPTLGVETSITTNAATTLNPNIAVRITGTTFSFAGTTVLFLNGTVDCFATVTFNTNVIFGYATPTTGNTITLRTGSTGWLPSTASIQVWRTSFVTDNTVTATIAPSLIFGLDTISFTTVGNGRLTLLGNLNVIGTSFTTSANVFLGVITINSAQNNTLNGLNLLGTLTLNSTTVPWVEPVVSITTLTQTLVLNGPARMNAPTFGTNAQIVGPSRIAITNALTVTSQFQFSAPVQLYVNSPSGTFQFTLTNPQTNLIFSTTPSLFNPLGFNTVLATNFALTSTDPNNILRFNLNSAFTLGDLTVNSGILQLTSSTTSTSQTVVAGGATLWIDGNAFTANQVIFNQNTDGTNPSVYQLTVSSLTPSAITTQAVVYKGVASVVVVNFNWDGTPITGITSTSANGATANFLSVTGTPGFQYTSTRNANSMQFRRTANPSVSPFPTQSNGPSPAVSSSSNVIVSVYLLFAVVILFFIF